MKPEPIIFTDLDGTLLEHQTYSFAAALPAIELVKDRAIPLVFCSSKTRPEIEYWRGRLDNRHPFIAENGGGIFVPFSYFSAGDMDAVGHTAERINGYSVLVLGTPYPTLRRVLGELQRDGFKIKGFGDMDTSEVAKITRLSPEEAKLAKSREFDEPFIFQGGPEELDRLLAAIEGRGLRYSQGKFYHIMGDNDKGKAVDVLKELYRRKFGDIITIALGDSPLDLPMLEKADHPVLVQDDKGEHDRRIVLPNLIRVEGIGPEGWSKAVLEFIQERL